MRRCQQNPKVLLIPTCGNVNHCYMINSIDPSIPDRRQQRASAKKQKAEGTVCTSSECVLMCICVCACVCECVWGLVCVHASVCIETCVYL